MRVDEMLWQRQSTEMIISYFIYKLTIVLGVKSWVKEDWVCGQTYHYHQSAHNHHTPHEHRISSHGVDCMDRQRNMRKIGGLVSGSKVIRGEHYLE